MATITDQLMFLGRVVRNGAILAGLYFFSVWVGGDITLKLFKPILIFLGTYILTELSRYYGLRQPVPKKDKKGKVNIKPFLY